jgi:MFS family permease
VLFSSLFARLPAIKSDVGLGEGEVGFALLCGAVGLIVSQPLAGALSTRFGSRPLSAAGLVLYGALVPLPAIAGELAPLALAFFALGAGSGLLDVAMNAQGALAEERHSRAIFSSFHAAFSFGAMGGAALAGAVAALGLDPAIHLGALGAAVIAIGLPVIRWMLPPAADAASGARLFARPSGPLAVLGAVAFCAAVSEGAVADWSAILLAEWRDASEGTAAAGLTAFSATMGFGRLAADPLRERLGSQRLLRLGAVTVLVGLVPVVAPLGLGAAVVGFAVLGAGLASLFPLALLLGSRVPGESRAAGIAAVSTAGYAGFLAGPAVIGFLAEATSLPAGMAILVPLALTVALLAPRSSPVPEEDTYA